MRLPDGLGLGPRVALPAALVGLQWLVAAVVAAVAAHDGWVYAADDARAGLAGAVEAADGGLPAARDGLGPGWALAVAPLVKLLGGTARDVAPVVVAINVLVLLPLALLATVGLAARVGGRLLGASTAAVWLAAPLFAQLLSHSRYDERLTDVVLPRALGLTLDPRFAAAALLAAGAFLLVRAGANGSAGDAALGGVATGGAALVTPTCLVLLPFAVAYALLVWRPRAAAWFVAGAAPALLALAIWRARTDGGFSALVLDDATTHTFDRVMSDLREYFTSQRLLQWAAIAGLIGLARRSVPATLLAGGWLAGFLLVEGLAPGVSVEDTSFFSRILPAWPGFVLAVAALPLLVPTLPRRARRLVEPVAGDRPLDRRIVAACVALLTIAPLVAVSAL
jgi:hypothetical protein